MPLLETPRAIHALDYWKRSQHLAALTPADREVFVMMVIMPDLNSTRDPLRRRLLNQLAERVQPAA